MILQQTRVEQGLPYYYRFLDKFPQINDLANAQESEVLLAWQGLGYYARARNMHKTAQFIRDHYNGEFPNTYENILGLKGIGPYTAAAISSFAFQLPVPAIDGNVKRVVARFYEIERDIMTQRFFNEAVQLLQDVIPRNTPDMFNQAMIELGATVCTPSNPDCMNCPIQTGCMALNKGKTGTLPVRISKTKISKRKLIFIEFTKDNQVFITLRPSDGIWGGLHEYPNVEVPENTPFQSLTVGLKFENVELESLSLEFISDSTHKLSHQHIQAYHFRCILPSNFSKQLTGGFWIPKKDLETIALHKLMLKFLEKERT